MSRDISLSLIDADPAQPRQYFDEAKIAELAESMQANGLIQPIMVRPVGERFVIVHGERRYRAALSLGWAVIPAEVRELDSEAARWLALVENIQRSDLSPIEEANAYKAMLDTGITQTKLGKRIGKGQSYIATKIRLLELPEKAQHGLVNGLISEGHAKQLLRLDTADHMELLYSASIDNEYNVRRLKDAVDKAMAFALRAKELEEGRLDNAPGSVYIPPTDAELLAAARVDPPWCDFWQAEDFVQCGSRYFGATARFIWLFSPLKVYHAGFKGDSSFVDAAIKTMGRGVERRADAADLLIVSIDPVATTAETVNLCDGIFSQAPEDAIIAIRFGPTELDGEHNLGQLSSLSKAQRHNSVVFICTLETEDYRDRWTSTTGARFHEKATLISSYESWLITSNSHIPFELMSRDIT